MPRSVGVAVGICSIVVAALQSAACSSSHPGSYSAAAGAAASSNANSSGGSDSLNVTGGNGNGDGTANSGSIGDKCAGDISTAMPIPLDLYIMLDISASMLAETATATTKWDAVKAAIESFLKDNASAGLGVGLQYFPIIKPNAPTSCLTDAQCGAFGPCIPINICYNSPASGLLLCNTDTDCGTKYGPCVPLAQCSKDTDYICPTPGAACMSTNPPLNLGTCTQTPSECANADSCDVTAYATPAHTIAPLPGAAATLVASIDAQKPAGNTPSAPALSGAIQQASAWAKAHPDHRVVTLLATDGVPTECASSGVNPVAEVAQIAQAGVRASPSISTFAIGVFGPGDVAQGAPANLNQISQQGGTGNAFIVDTQKDVTAQFLSALDTIRGARLACEFQIPQPAAGETLDYGRVNVQLTNGTSKDVVYYVKSAAACDAGTGGWYYDVDPTLSAPTKIIACPTSCAAFKAAPTGASVDIALGCLTETIVK